MTFVKKVLSNPLNMLLFTFYGFNKVTARNYIAANTKKPITLETGFFKQSYKLELARIDARWVI